MFDPTTIKPFDGYEIQKVIESKDGICEPFIGTEEELAAERAKPDYVREFWTLYGHLPEGGVEAFSDVDTEEAALELLYRITGIVGTPGGYGPHVYMLNTHRQIEEGN